MREELLHALRRANLERAKELIDQGANINETDGYGESLLADVTVPPREQGERLRIARFMLEHGADPTILDKEKSGPLYSAVLHHDAELLRLLLDHGADPNRERGFVPSETLYDFAVFDYQYDCEYHYHWRAPERPTEEDHADADAFLQYLERVAEKYDGPSTEYLKVLRNRGAKTGLEEE